MDGVDGFLLLLIDIQICKGGVEEGGVAWPL